MSLSQKHAGKILVPWFNSEEWRFVYKCAFSESKEEQQRALDILKVWKIRTPILSTGVEGTLILLEAVLTDEALSRDKIAQIYSLSLLRFLNISAANNEKQGTFSKSAEKNELPKWLIDIRHDIAHGQRMPSLSLLKLCIEHCFEWLRQKYWEPQNEVIEDYTIEEESESEILTSLLNIYVPFNSSFHQNKSLLETKTDIKKLKQFIYKKFRKSCESPREVLSVLDELLYEAFKNDKEKNIGKYVAEILATDKGLLNILHDADGDRKIVSKQSLAMWEKVLVMLHENKYLFCILDKLYEITGSITLLTTQKVTAALWIDELLYSLEKLKKIKNEGELAEDEINAKEKYKEKNGALDEKHIFFKDRDFLYVEEAKEFETKVLATPNDCCLYFLERLLRYNENDEIYIKITIDTLKQISSEHQLVDAENEIHTIENLDLESDVEMELDLVNDSSNSALFNSKMDDGIKWRRIIDTSVFRNCPLGILPHQNRKVNPLINFY